MISSDIFHQTYSTSDVKLLMLSSVLTGFSSCAVVTRPVPDQPDRVGGWISSTTRALQQWEVNQNSAQKRTLAAMTVKPSLLICLRGTKVPEEFQSSTFRNITKTGKSRKPATDLSYSCQMSFLGITIYYLKKNQGVRYNYCLLVFSTATQSGRQLSRKATVFSTAGQVAPLRH